MTEKKYLKNEYIEMRIEDGVFWGRYLNGVVIDEECAIKVMNDRELLCGNTPYATIWDCREVAYWTKSARSFQNSDLNYRLMKAGAIVYTESHVTTIIINFFLNFSKPPIPAQFFTSLESAHKWIQKYK
ncbi:MAG TPA: hypothetical protein VIK89_00910 [Cytophagaceae bacterium]